MSGAKQIIEEQKRKAFEDYYKSLDKCPKCTFVSYPKDNKGKCPNCGNEF